VDLEVPQFQTNPYAFEVGDLHFRFLKYTLAMDTWMHPANPKWFTTHWSNWGYSVYILQRQLGSVHSRPCQSERPCVPSHEDASRTQRSGHCRGAVRIYHNMLPRLGPFYWSANRTNQVASWTLTVRCGHKLLNLQVAPRSGRNKKNPQQLPWTQ